MAQARLRGKQIELLDRAISRWPASIRPSARGCGTTPCTR